MFTYTTLAQQIIFAPGGINQIEAAVTSLGVRRLLLITSASLVRGGEVGRLAAALGTTLVATFSRTEAHVQDYQLAEVSALAQTQAIDGLIGLGGGSVIGLAKALSQTGAVALPVIAIPSTYAGSEMTPVYGITHHLADGSSRKITVRDPKVAPRLILYDPDITLTLPAAVTAGTGINALAHCFEALYSVTANPLASAAALAGIRAINQALPLCLADGQNRDARAEMLLGAHLGGTALATVEMALHHGLCHVLGGTAGVAHGVANAIMLPHVLQFNQDAAAGQLAQAAQAMGLRGNGEKELVAAAIRQVRTLISQTGLPPRLRDVGVAAHLIPQLAATAISSATVHKNPRPITSVDELINLYQAAW
ncbi:MAG: iron-containing alcohol dehydrogenase [Candidatus Promineifilaceae bacterium]|nr:iron-containing alcohol dehydrogenase [Chloroflexota bacterium]